MIHQLRRDGLSIGAIVRRTGLDRKTVRKYLALGLDVPAYGPRPPQPSVIDDFRAYLMQRLEAFPELTAVRLCREVRELGYQGGYDTVKRAVARLRPPRESGFEHRFETPPGRQAQVDFAYFQVRFDAEPDQLRTVWLFSLVLGHSTTATSSTTGTCWSSPATSGSRPAPAPPTGPRPRARSSGRSATSGRTSSWAAGSATWTT